MFGNTIKILCSLPWIQGLVPEDGKFPLPPKSFSTPTRARGFTGPCVLIGIVQLLSLLWHFAITCMAAKQASLSFTLFGVSSNSCPLSRGYRFIVSSFWYLSFCQQCFPASGSLPMSWVFTSCGLNVGALSSVSVFALNIALPLPKQNSCFQTANNI